MPFRRYSVSAASAVERARVTQVAYMDVFFQRRQKSNFSKDRDEDFAARKSHS